MFAEGPRPGSDLVIVPRAGKAAILAAAFLAGSSLARSAEWFLGWREEVATMAEGNFLLSPVKLGARYVFGWSGIEAAEARTTLRRGADGVWTGTVTGGTKGWARSLYKLDAEYRTEVSEKDWRSLKTRQTEKYRAYRTDEKAEFLPGGVRSWRGPAARQLKTARN